MNPPSHVIRSPSCLHEEHSWSKKFPPTFYTAKWACFSKYVCFLQVLSMSSAQICGFLCALESEPGPPLPLLLLCAMGVTGFPVFQVCGQAKGTETRAGSENAGKLPLLNPNGKEGLFLQKTFGFEETSPAARPCQGNASELWCAKSRAPLGKGFFCNSHLIHVFISVPIHC